MYVACPEEKRAIPPTHATEKEPDEACEAAMSLATELETALQSFYSPASSNEEKRHIEQKLQEFKLLSDCWSHCVQFLESSNNEYVVWYALNVLEHFVSTRWHTLSLQDRRNVREFLSNYIQKYANQGIAKHVFTKASKVVVLIAMKDLPDDWSDYFIMMSRYATSGNENHCEIGLVLLKITCEEFNSSSNTHIVSSKRKELLNLLHSHVATMINWIIQVLQKCFVSQQQLVSSGNYSASSLAKLAFECLTQMMTWIPLNECFTPDLMKIIFGYIGLLYSPHSVQGITCLAELLNKNYVPKNLEGFTLETASNALNILQNLVNQENLESFDEDFIDRFIYFLSTFLENHLVRVESNPQFPMVEFLTLLYKFTFCQITSDSFLNCCDIWILFVNHIELRSTDESFDTTIYISGLSSLLFNLLTKIQWDKSEAFLVDLDDSAPLDESADGGEFVEVATNSRDNRHKYHQHFNNTELRQYISTVLELIAKISLLPVASNSFVEPLLQEVFSLMGQKVQVFSKTVEIRQQGGGNLLTYSVRDLLAKQLIQWCIDIQSYSTNHRLHTYGIEFVDLHLAAINQLMSFSQFFNIYGTLTNASHALVNDLDKLTVSSLISTIADCKSEMFDTLLNAIINQCISVLDFKSVTGPPPEMLMLASIDLLDTVVSNIQPVKLFEYQATGAVYEHLAEFTKPFSVIVKCSFYVVISNSIISPLLKLPQSDITWQSKQPVYLGLLNHLSNELNDASNNLNQQSVNVVKTNMAILSAICDSVSNQTKIVKEFVFGILQSTLLSSLKILSTFVPALQQAVNNSSRTVKMEIKMSINISKDCLNFILNVFKVFGKQIGVASIQQTMETIVSLFSNGNIGLSIVSHGRSGCLLLYKLINLMCVLMSETSNAFTSLMSGILSLSLNNLYTVLKTEVLNPVTNEFILDILKLYYKLIHNILRQHWRWFVKTESQNINGQILRTKAFKSEETKQHFIKCMEIILESFDTGSFNLPPSLFSLNLQILDDLNKTQNLYQFEFFNANMKSAFIKLFVNVYLTNSHVLLHEELVVVIYGLVITDYNGFVTQYLPSLCMHLNLQQQQHLTSIFQLSDTDLPSFSKKLATFMEDFRCFSSSVG